MLLLSDQGWTVPRLARHLGRCEATVRRWLRQFEAEGVDAVRHKPLGTGPHHARRQRITQALHRLLADEDRVWSAVTRAEALAQGEGLHLRPRTVRKYLHLMGARYRRTTYPVRHQQDPTRVAQARMELAALKKSRDGALALFYRDECGFAMTMPPTYTWYRRGTRHHTPYAYAQGRRVNALAALAAPGTCPDTPLPSQVAARTWQSADLLTFLREELPTAGGRPRVVVLDNASLHRSRVIRDALPELDAQGIRLHYLPPYAPERNDIERVFRTVKHTAMPVRTFEEVSDLIAAVEAGFTTVRDRLLSGHSSMVDA